MCEYCGCREIATIRELTREHDAVVAEIALVRRFLSEDNLDAAGTSAARIAEILDPHTVVEEAGLFPLMEEDFPDHILKEQDGVFPASATILDTGGWQGLEEIRARVGNAIDPEQHRFDDEEQP